MKSWKHRLGRSGSPKLKYLPTRLQVEDHFGPSTCVVSIFSLGSRHKQPPPTKWSLFTFFLRSLLRLPIHIHLQHLATYTTLLCSIFILQSPTTPNTLDLYTSPFARYAFYQFPCPILGSVPVRRVWNVILRCQKSNLALRVSRKYHRCATRWHHGTVLWPFDS